MIQFDPRQATARVSQSCFLVRGGAAGVGNEGSASVKFRLITMIIQGFLGAALAACGSSGGVKKDDIPASLRVPDGQQLVEKVQAKGVQIYVCQPTKNDPARYEWAFKAPEADLLGRGSRKVGTHYAGPSWESTDGSKVVGSVVAKETPDPNSIPWLLLSAKSNAGKGIFSDVKSIQRLRTVGGIAPAGGCGQSQAGQELRTSYSADYVFYR
jgi:Protein of unknown function (DUF3455)